MYCRSMRILHVSALKDSLSHYYSPLVKEVDIALICGCQQIVQFEMSLELRFHVSGIEASLTTHLH